MPITAPTPTIQCTCGSVEVAGEKNMMDNGYGIVKKMGNDIYPDILCLIVHQPQYKAQQQSAEEKINACMDEAEDKRRGKDAKHRSLPPSYK